MEPQKDRSFEDVIHSVSDLVTEQEYFLSETLRMELENKIHDECLKEVIRIKREEQDSLNGFEAQDDKDQANEYNINVFDSNDAAPETDEVPFYQLPENKSIKLKPTLSCSFCDYETFHAGFMRLHIRRHKTFKAPTPVFKRKLKHIFRCDQCDYKTGFKSSLKVHIRRWHELETHEIGRLWIHHIKPYEPPKICDHDNLMDLYMSDSLNASEKKSKDDKPYKCPDCDFKTVGVGYLNRHIQSHREREKRTEPRVFMCEVCGYRTNRSSSLSIHKRRHKKKEETKSEEPKVPKLDQHNLFFFQETYKCETCDFRATTKRQLYRHNKKHKKPLVKKIKVVVKKEREIIQCNFCDYHSKDKYAFNTHLKSHSFILTEKDTFKCSFCDYRTIRNVCLKVHMTRAHNSADVIMNKCNQCSYETLHRNDFKKHLLSHKPLQEVKMAKCLECDYETLHKSNLNSHVIRRHRTNEELEMFYCYNCEYKTPFKSRLKEHVIIHRTPNVQEMHKCPYCEYQTMRKRNRMIHIRLHHKNDKLRAKVKDA